MRRIIAGTDFSPGAGRAVARAAMLAAAHRTPLEVVHVTRPVPQGLLARLGLRRQHAAQVTKALREQLSATAGEARARGAKVRARLLNGDVAEAIGALADAGGAELTVAGAHGERTIRDTLLGTTAERLIERTRCDVLVVKAAAKAAYANVLVCADLGPASASALAAAAALGSGARLTLLYVYEPPFEMKLLGAGVTDETLGHHRLASAREAQRELEGFLGGVSTPDASISMVARQGLPSQVILETATQLKSDLVVVGRNAARLSELFIGSTSKHVLRSARCDVLVSVRRDAHERPPSSAP